jgi:hypothetical protein
MPDSPAGRSFDTVVIPAALVPAGGSPAAMGHDTVRIPVRVVTRTSAAGSEPAGGTGPAGMQAQARAAPGNAGGGAEPTPAVAAPSGSARPPSPDQFGDDPIATFLRANEALERIAGDGDAGTPTAPQAGGKDGPSPLYW